MSYYHKYDFVSIEPMWAVIKEELRSYFESGSVDDLMFPIWADRALKVLYNSPLRIEETILEQKNFESKLPPDFGGGLKSVREAWLCARIDRVIQQPNSKYDQVFCKVTPSVDECNPCSPCFPDILRVTYKSNHSEVVPDGRLQRVFLLKPGNVNECHNLSSRYHPHHEHSAWFKRNWGGATASSFDVRDNKFITEAREGIVHLIYYAKPTDEAGAHLIPDNYWIQEYVKRYIKFKIFEQLFNQVTDETFNQVEKKMEMYKASYEEAKIMVEIEVKKPTIYQEFMSIRKDLHRNDMYRLR